jgi:monofunctional biosynthetic peptidoglycan transglycosylase
LIRTVLRWVALASSVVLIAVVGVQLWYLGWVAWWKWNNPEQTAFMAREATALRQKNPKAELKHRWVAYGGISVYLKRAVIASEDARFSEHEGVDWDAVEKAYMENVKRGRPAKGGSTITQQLAKNLFLSPERSYVRKAQELVITYMIEALWDKRRILEVYLNVVEWGDGIFGAEAAARHYYGVSAAQLGPEQAARLAAYLPNPKRYGRVRFGPYLDRRTASIARNMPEAAVP